MAQRAARIVSDNALGGEPRIAGRRIGVLQVYEEVENGALSPRSFADRYNLDVEAVYRTLAYYHEHPKELTDVRNQHNRRIEGARAEAISAEECE